MSRPFTKLSDKIYRTNQYDLEKINIRKNINENNISILRTGTLIMAVAFAAMLILAYFFEQFRENLPFYIFESVSNAVLCISTRKYFVGRERAATFGVYAFIELMYYSGIYVDIIARQNICTVTGCLFLGVLPLMFIDDVLRIMFFSTITLAANIILMIKVRNDPSVPTDIINLTFSWFWGIFLCISVNRIKLKSYINEHIIATERDTDSMTGLWNKNSLTQKVTEEITKEGSRGSFFMMDIDHFKQLNDTFGHSYGDEILIKAAECMQKVFGSNDILGRFGGDEFIFYVPDADREKAGLLAEKLLRAVYDDIKIMSNGSGLNVSLGIVVYEYVPNMTYDRLMNMADQALYITKENGRFGYTLFNDKNKMERKTIEV